MAIVALLVSMMEHREAVVKVPIAVVLGTVVEYEGVDGEVRISTTDPSVICSIAGLLDRRLKANCLNNIKTIKIDALATTAHHIFKKVHRTNMILTKTWTWT